MSGGDSQDLQGAAWDGEGVRFGLYSEHASNVELCLFDAAGNETRRVALTREPDSVWRTYVPGLAPAQRYGYRVAGPDEPERGLRFNASKLLLDPYAREIDGALTWAPELFAGAEAGTSAAARARDSAPFVPKALVTAPEPAPQAASLPRVPWSETIVYETHVRGFTMRHPALGAHERGRFRGLRNRDALAYIKALGVTSVELMPVHAFVDEAFLHQRGLRNFWGYNTLGFFAPEPKYLGGGGRSEFRRMVDAIHDMNLEVILDVVYNHTAEGGAGGPSLSFRGIDNPVYYRLLAEDPSEYVDDTGVGNTLNTEHAQVRRLILDSLRYWAHDMGVDGFRFDLATTLARTAAGFDAHHPLLEAIGRDRVLSRVKLIAEPWDVGPGGYRLGAFPRPWAEWNDRFRDGVRAFWRGDTGAAAELARRVHGSADVFEHGGRGPAASVNYVASHDGFTTADAVSYVHRHNEANGENNEDGHARNFSCNHGVEGPTDDPAINAARRRHRLNLLATVLLSQGTPMLLAGDEFGNSQAGNNNAYAQDNETGWLDWNALEADPAFCDEVRRLIRLRGRVDLFRSPEFLHGRRRGRHGLRDIEWLDVDGKPMPDEAWPEARTLCLLLSHAHSRTRAGEPAAAAVLFNVSDGPATFRLPGLDGPGQWRLEFASEPAGDAGGEPGFDVAAGSLACCVYMP